MRADSLKLVDMIWLDEEITSCSPLRRALGDEEIFLDYWGRYEQVSRFLPEQESQALLARKADLGDDFAMADDEVTSIQFAPGADEATVVTEFTWYNQRRALVRKSTIEQRWRWDDGRWMVAEQRRIHGDRFPLVPERLQEAAATAAAPARRDLPQTSR